MNLTTRQVFSRLRRGDTVLAGKVKNQPLILFCHGRWHMITVGFLCTLNMKLKKGISCVHFMSDYRGRKTVKEWLPYSKLLLFKEVYPAFQEEIAAKVLPDGESYRSWLEKGRMTLAGGYTTDTLQSTGAAQNDIDQLIAAINQMMNEGQMGPFLHFE